MNPLFDSDDSYIDMVAMYDGVAIGIVDEFSVVMHEDNASGRLPGTIRFAPAAMDMDYVGEPIDVVATVTRPSDGSTRVAVYKDVRLENQREDGSWEMTCDGRH